MWGEIDPPVITTPSLCKNEDKKKTAEKPEKQSTVTEQDSAGVLQAESLCVSSMVEAIAKSSSPVKSQQIGEAELSLSERREELLQQYRSRPLVFLERYHSRLKPEDLSAFAHVSSDPRAQHYGKVIQRRAAACTSRTRVRNQRYAALRALQKDGQYFSEEQMRIREPLLYEQYIGQYLTDEEVIERSHAMQDAAEGAPAGGAGGLADLLLNSYQERLIQNRLQEEQEREEGAQEEEEDEDDAEYSAEPKGWEPNAEEKALLREEFISQMHQRFLEGKDKDFNYSEVDENPDYDNLDIVSRDAEDKYFDEDDDDEEEEEEDVEEAENMLE